VTVRKPEELVTVPEIIPFAVMFVDPPVSVSESPTTLNIVPEVIVPDPFIVMMPRIATGLLLPGESVKT